MNEWIECKTKLPAENVVVETKIDNESGTSSPTIRYRVGNDWFFSEDNRKAFYAPTHWRPMNDRATSGKLWGNDEQTNG